MVIITINPILTNQVEEEEERLTQAVQDAPENPVALIALANFFSRKNPFFAEADELYNRAIAIVPEDAHVRAQYADFWANRFCRAPWTVDSADECKEKAEQEFLKAIEIDPSQSETHALYANFLWKGRGSCETAHELPASLLAAAEEQYQAAVALDPQNVQALNDYATFLLWAKRDYVSISALYEQAIAADPDNFHTYLGCACALAMIQPDTDRVNAIFDQAREIAPVKNFRDTYLTFVLRHKADKSAAGPLLNQLLAEDPDNWVIHLMNGDFLLVSEQDLTRAKKEYDICSTLLPPNPHPYQEASIILRRAALATLEGNTEDAKSILQDFPVTQLSPGVSWQHTSTKLLNFFLICVLHPEGKETSQALSELKV